MEVSIVVVFQQELLLLWMSLCCRCFRSSCCDCGFPVVDDISCSCLRCGSLCVRCLAGVVVIVDVPVVDDVSGTVVVIVDVSLL